MGSGRVSQGLTSDGLTVAWITISKGSRRVTLAGRVGSKQTKWERTYPRTAIPLDD